MKNKILLMLLGTLTISCTGNYDIVEKELFNHGLIGRTEDPNKILLTFVGEYDNASARYTISKDLKIRYNNDKDKIKKALEVYEKVNNFPQNKHKDALQKCIDEGKLDSLGAYYFTFPKDVKAYIPVYGKKAEALYMELPRAFDRIVKDYTELSNSMYIPGMLKEDVSKNSNWWCIGSQPSTQTLFDSQNLNILYGVKTNVDDFKKSFNIPFEQSFEKLFEDDDSSNNSPKETVVKLGIGHVDCVENPNYAKNCDELLKLFPEEGHQKIIKETNRRFKLS